MRARLAISADSAISNITCFSIERKSDFSATHLESIVKISTSFETMTCLLTPESAHCFHLCVLFLRKPSKVRMSGVLFAKYPRWTQSEETVRTRDRVVPLLGLLQLRLARSEGDHLNLLSHVRP